VSVRCNLCGEREYVLRTDHVVHFVKLALIRRKLFKQVACIAHNTQGYDAKFIFKYLVEKSEREKPTVLLTGTKIMMMSYRGIKSIDSLNYSHMSLSSLPKAYALRGQQSKQTTRKFFFLVSKNY